MSPAFAAAQCSDRLDHHHEYRKLPGWLRADEGVAALLRNPFADARQITALVVRESADGHAILWRLGKTLERERRPFVLIGPRPYTNLNPDIAIPTVEDVIIGRREVLERFAAKLHPGTTLLIEGIDWPVVRDEDVSPFHVFMAISGVLDMHQRGPIIYASHYLFFDEDLDRADEIGAHARIIRTSGRF